MIALVNSHSECSLVCHSMHTSVCFVVYCFVVAGESHFVVS